MIDFFTVFLGIILTIIASSCFSLGFILQKKGVSEGLPELDFEEGLSTSLKAFTEFLKNKTWISGILIGLIGWFPYIFAISLVGITFVQPLTNIGLIVFVISAIKILKEKIKLIEIISVILLILAPVFFTIAGISNVSFDLREFQFPFSLFLLLLASIAIICYFFSKKQINVQWDGILITFSGAIFYSISTIFTNVFTQALKIAQVDLISWFGWVEVVFGIFWFDLSHLWIFFGFWGMLIFYGIGLILSQSGFQKVRTLFVCLILNSVSLFLSTIAGLFIFNQTFSNIGFFLIGIGIITFSIITLSKFQAEFEQIE